MAATIDIDERRARRGTTRQRNTGSARVKARSTREPTGWDREAATREGIGLSLSELLGEVYQPAAAAVWLDPNDDDAA
jgi:hypothetical protein